MKQINLYLKDDFNNCFQGWEEVKPFKVLQVEDNVDLWGQAVLIDGEYYSVCSSQEENYKVIKLPKFDLNHKEEYLRNEITCPICGYQTCDGWEYDWEDGANTVECDGCGAILEAEMDCVYSTTVKEKVKPIKL